VSENSFDLKLEEARHSTKEQRRGLQSLCARRKIMEICLSVGMRLLRDTPSAFKDKNIFIFEDALIAV
jgi:hypothetical protein